MSEVDKKAEKKEKRRIKRLNRWFGFLRFCYYVLTPVLMPIKKLGHKKKYLDGPYVFVGNHRSVLDVIPIASAVKAPVHFLAKKELTSKAIGRWFVNKSECVLVNRDGQDVRALMQSMKYLKNGETISLFPEGTRNKTDEPFLPFKSGAAMMAIRTKTPIILVVHGRKLRFFRRNYFYFAEPFEFTEYYDKKLTEELIKEADGKLYQKMLEIYLALNDMLESKKKRKK